MISYKKEFKSFVDKCVANKYLVGTGNSNSKILLIGKEAAISKEDENKINQYNDNARSWKNHINDGTCEVLAYNVDEKHDLRKGWGRNTWSKYQKLKDLIFKEKPKKFRVDFLEKCFTTEINDAPSKNTATADKKGLNERKKLFKNSAFIQQFPVIVLACSNYITNYGEIREIDNVFDVTYDGDDTGKYVFTKQNWFFTHHNSDKSKLVIHTRQLSANVKNEMLEKISEIIREHLQRVN